MASRSHSELDNLQYKFKRLEEMRQTIYKHRAGYSSLMALRIDNDSIDSDTWMTRSFTDFKPRIIKDHRSSLTKLMYHPLRRNRRRLPTLQVRQQNEDTNIPTSMGLRPVNQNKITGIGSHNEPEASGDSVGDYKTIIFNLRQEVRQLKNSLAIAEISRSNTDVSLHGNILEKLIEMVTNNAPQHSNMSCEWERDLPTVDINFTQSQNDIYRTIYQPLVETIQEIYNPKDVINKSEFNVISVETQTDPAEFYRVSVETQTFSKSAIYDIESIPRSVLSKGVKYQTPSARDAKDASVPEVNEGVVEYLKTTLQNACSVIDELQAERVTDRRFFERDLEKQRILNVKQTTELERQIRQLRAMLIGINVEEEHKENHPSTNESCKSITLELLARTSESDLRQQLIIQKRKFNLTQEKLFTQTENLKKSQSVCHQLTESITAIKKQLHAVRSDLADERKKNYLLHTELKDMSAKKLSFQQRVITLKNQMRIKSGLINELNQELKDIKVEHGLLQARLKSAEGSNLNKKCMMTNYKTKIQELETSLHDHVEILKVLKIDINSFKGSSLKLRTQTNRKSFTKNVEVQCDLFVGAKWMCASKDSSVQTDPDTLRLELLFSNLNLQIKQSQESHLLLENKLHQYERSIDNLLVAIHKYAQMKDTNDRFKNETKTVKQSKEFARVLLNLTTSELNDLYNSCSKDCASIRYNLNQWMEHCRSITSSNVFCEELPEYLCKIILSVSQDI